MPLRVFTIALLLGLQQPARSQQPGALPLDWLTFRREVLTNHPLARQADLYRAQADAAWLRARGGFDPKAYAEGYGKNFQGKNYFQYGEAGVKIPTWAGLNVKGAYLQTSGAYLNPEARLPEDGQATVGILWSVGQGLLFDERRADLRQARIGRRQAEAERAAALNDLLFNAAKAYWTWAAAANQLALYQEAAARAAERHQGLVESFRQGDKPAIDTLETFIQWQNRQLDVNFASTEVQTDGLALNAFRWAGEGAGTLPVRLEALPVAAVFPSAKPLVVAADDLEIQVQNALARHPDLQAYSIKLETLAVERRLKNEKRKPVLDLEYNLLGSGWTFFPSATAEGPGVLANDIKWGATFAYPLLNRKARGDWQVTQIKTEQTELALRQKRREVEAKVRQYAAERNNLAAQIALYQSTTDNYRRLFEAEAEKFRLGESSVFLLNTREQRLLEVQAKYLKLLSEYYKAEAGLAWAEGGLGID